MASTPGVPHTGDLGSFKLDFVTPLHLGGAMSPMSSYTQDFTPQQFFSGAPPPWIQDDSIDVDELQQDLDECRRSRVFETPAPCLAPQDIVHSLLPNWGGQTLFIAFIIRTRAELEALLGLPYTATKMNSPTRRRYFLKSLTVLLMMSALHRSFLCAAPQSAPSDN